MFNRFEPEVTEAFRNYHEDLLEQILNGYLRYTRPKTKSVLRDICVSLYIVIVSLTCFRVNPHSIVA